jgi:hypothetical protein
MVTGAEASDTSPLEHLTKAEPGYRIIGYNRLDVCIRCTTLSEK